MCSISSTRDLQTRQVRFSELNRADPFFFELFFFPSKKKHAYKKA